MYWRVVHRVFPVAWVRADNLKLMTIPLELWLSMLLFASVTSITPGPNNMMVLASGVNFGYRKTLPHLLGISIGHSFMCLMVGLGLGKVFTLWPLTYTVLKVLGVLYMVYLAWGVARSAAPAVASAEQSQAKPLGFWGAAAFQWVNPKAWMMALMFFGNFMPQNAGLALVIAASLMFASVNFPCVSVWALLGARLRRYLQVDRHRKAFNWTMAILLVASMLPVLNGA